MEQLSLFTLDGDTGTARPLAEAPLTPPQPSKQCACVYQGVACTNAVPAGRRKYCSAQCARLAREKPKNDAYYDRKHRREIRMRRSDRAYARILKRPGSTFRLG